MGIRYNEDMSIITIPRILREKLGDEGADAFVKVINESETASRKDLAIKEDMLRLESKLTERMTKIEGELTLIKWMMGIMLAGVISLVIKAFFMH
ncbi:MAG: DUF1640 domain-containing protein [Nitrospirae bacterium]|nr:DUF1640 domain-containing protein [Nitrospirota bacterium]